jgi:hypothetical protein
MATIPALPDFLQHVHWLLIRIAILSFPPLAYDSRLPFIALSLIDLSLITIFTVHKRKPHIYFISQSIGKGK